MTVGYNNASHFGQAGEEESDYNPNEDPLREETSTRGLKEIVNDVLSCDRSEISNRQVRDDYDLNSD